MKRRPILVAGGIAATVLAGSTALGITIAQTGPSAAAPAVVRYVDQYGRPVAAPTSAPAVSASTTATSAPSTAAGSAANATKAAASIPRYDDRGRGDDNGD